MSRERGDDSVGEEERWGVTGEEGREGVRVSVESSSTCEFEDPIPERGREREREREREGERERFE